MLRELVVFVASVAMFFSVQNVAAQQLKAEIVAFYNLENLFDTIDSPNVRDTEFTPQGSKKWTSARYKEKINNVAKAISMLGTPENLAGPAVIGLSEMENHAVLDDLIHSDYLKPLNYAIVHFDSPDKRGIDVALLYRTNHFKVTSTRSVPLIINGDDGKRVYTRDQLVVSGILDGEPMSFIVNHWPSRYGGEARSRGLRMAAARLTRSLVDSICVINEDAKVIVMGDLNDNPSNESVRVNLNTGFDKNNLKAEQLFNATEVLFRQGKGSLPYRGKWDMFDQLIMTPALVDKNNKGYCFHSVRVFYDPMLVQQEGEYKGYALRTYVGNNYMGGYSDHFPVYVLLVKEVSD
ncbi:endonuclease/exonuclease/phosphatase family protein [Geofilum sp. OHC36d9]|uniref:endonuclease/exonuclease/phosphatase family protein n=1 Tax=Geofilum sp. OHC36d9 TaxID=3458413 RepID=UPI0040332ED3